MRLYKYSDLGVAKWPYQTPIKRLCKAFSLWNVRRACTYSLEIYSEDCPLDVTAYISNIDTQLSTAVLCTSIPAFHVEQKKHVFLQGAWTHTAQYVIFEMTSSTPIGHLALSLALKGKGRAKTIQPTPTPKPQEEGILPYVGMARVDQARLLA